MIETPYIFNNTFLKPFCMRVGLCVFVCLSRESPPSLFFSLVIQAELVKGLMLME